MYLPVISLLDDRALGHAEDNLRTSVVKNNEVIAYRIDGEAFDLAGAPEITHLAQQLKTSGLGTARNLASPEHRLSSLIQLHAERRVLYDLLTVYEARIWHVRHVSDVYVVGNVPHRLAVVRREKHLAVGDEDALSPVWHRAALHLAVVCARLQVVCIYVAAVDPVAHPYEFIVAVHTYARDFHLA